jgi:hypothetical protein
VVLTAWFVVFVVQTGLVVGRRTDLHRRLGIAGVAIAAMLVAIRGFVTAQSAFAFSTSAINPVESLESFSGTSRA